MTFSSQRPKIHSAILASVQFHHAIILVSRDFPCMKTVVAFQLLKTADQAMEEIDDAGNGHH